MTTIAHTAACIAADLKLREAKQAETKADKAHREAQIARAGTPYYSTATRDALDETTRAVGRAQTVQAGACDDCPACRARS